MIIGSTWRNRCGQFVTIEYKASTRSWYVRHESDNGLTGYIVDINGHHPLRTRADLSLMERATRVYIAGPMTGLPDLNFPAFHAAAEDYRKRGCFVLNPAEINPDPTMGWADAMKRDIPALLTCEMIVMLPGHEASKGASLELHIARSLGMAVVWPEEVPG